MAGSRSREMHQIKTTVKLLCCLLCLCFVSQLKAEQELFFESDGVNIHYSDLGEGKKAVVLLHGYTMDLSMWFDSGIANELARDYRVIAIDLRGHGESDKPFNVEDYGPKVGLDVIKLLDYLEVPEAHMVGFSMGAFMIGRLLVTHPERVLTATLGSGSFPISNDDETKFQESTAKDMEQHGDFHLASVARGWALDAVTREQIAKINTPIQAVFGSEEAGDFYDFQKALIALPKSARPILVIEGADHDTNNAAVLHPDFLRAAKDLINASD